MNHKQKFLIIFIFNFLWIGANFSKNKDNLKEKEIDRQIVPSIISEKETTAVLQKNFEISPFKLIQFPFDDQLNKKDRISNRWVRMTFCPPGVPMRYSDIWVGLNNGVAAVTEEGIITILRDGEWTCFRMSNFRPIALYGNDKNEIYVAGENGALFNYDGSNWTKIETGVKDNFFSVWIGNDNTVVAVGQRGVIVLFDKSKIKIFKYLKKVDLFDVWGFSGKSIFVVGDYGTLLYYDGERWKESKIVEGGTFFAVRESSEGTIWVISKQGEIFRRISDKWEKVVNKKKDDFTSIFVLPDGRIYAGGKFGIYKFTGKDFELLDAIKLMDIKFIGGRSEDDIYLVGESHYLYHFDGKSIMKIAGDPTERLNDIWGSDPDNIFMVGGEEGGIWHFNGKSLSLVRNGSGKGLNAIYGVSKDCIFAAGYNQILFFNGKNWNEVNTGKSLKGLNDVWLPSCDEVLIAGDEGTIIHLKNGVWEYEKTGTPADLKSIWGFNSKNIYVVGNEGTMLHYDGIKWSVENSGVFTDLMAIAGYSPERIYVAGGYFNMGVLLQFNGKLFKLIARGNIMFYSMFASPDGNVYLTGGNCESCGPYDYAFHFNEKYMIEDKVVFNISDTETLTETSEETFDSGALNSIWGPSFEDIWMVGDGIFKYIHGQENKEFTKTMIPEKYNEEKWWIEDGLLTIKDAKKAGWIVESIKDAGHLFGVWGRKFEDAFVVGEKGIILHRKRGKWEKMDSGTTSRLMDIWGFGESNIWAAGADGVILHYDGNRWSQQKSGTSAHLTSLWGFSENELYAGGFNGKLLRWDGSSWSVIPTGITENIVSLWGKSSEDFYASTGKGGLFHFKKGEWKRVDERVIYEVWGVSGGERVFKGGESIFSYKDRKEWKDISIENLSGDFIVKAIYGNSVSDIYGAGYLIRYDGYTHNGVIVHFDGQEWKTFSYLGMPWFNDIWETPEGEVIAVGYNGTICSKSKKK